MSERRVDRGVVSGPPIRIDRTEALWLALAPVVGRLTLAVLGAFLAMWVFVRLAHEMAEGETVLFDTTVLHFLQAHRQAWLFQVMAAISWFGGPQAQPLFVGVCVLGFILARRFWPDGLTFLLAAAGGGVLMYALKRFFHRPRPEAIFDVLGYSFPSGHSFFALVVYCMLAYWLGRDATPRVRIAVWTAAVAATLLMGFSRIYLGEHYPSDVAAGFAVAIPWVWGCLALPKAFHRGGRDISPEEKRAVYQEGLARLRAAAVFLPNLVRLLGQLAQDPRVPRSRKAAVLVLGAYLASPVDLVPDFIPLFGIADDLLLVSLVLPWVIRSVPSELVQEHWDGETDLASLIAGVRMTFRELRRRG